MQWDSDNLIRLQSHSRQSCTERGRESKISIHGPQHRRKLLNQDPQASFTFARTLLRALSLDGKSDLASDGRKKFKIPLRIRVSIFVVLQDQHPDGLVGRA